MQIPILYFIDFLNTVSGTEKHVFDLARSLDRTRFKPYVVTFQGTESFRAEFERLDIPVWILDMTKIYGVKPFRMFSRLGAFIRREGIKIVQTFHTNPDIYGTVLARANGVPVVVSSRRDMGLGRNGRNVLCYRLLNRSVDRIICVCERVKSFVMEDEGVPESKISIVYNGLDPAHYDRPADPALERRRLGLPSGAPVVGMLANFNVVKGHAYLIEAAHEIRKSVPGTRFILAGTGPNEARLREQVRALGLGGIVEFIGHRRDVSAVLSVMDVLVAPSLSEGFSNTLIEALYAEKPVVATNVGGNPEVIQDGRTGLLIPPADAVAVARSVIRLLRDRELARRLGGNGRGMVLDRFLIRTMVDRTVDIYETLLRDKGIPVPSGRDLQLTAPVD